MNSRDAATSLPALDEHGHLVDAGDWSPAVARGLAQADGIELTDAHWRVIGILRTYYAKFEIAPPMRALVKILREELGRPDLESRELYRLFPEGPAKQGCRYAGLPKPVSCI